MELPQHRKITKKINKQNFEINRCYKRCICHYCNSMAVKQMFMNGHSSFFICEKCANNIIRSKMQICNDPKCVFPSIREFDLVQYYIEHFECQVCKRYLWHLRYGFETHFVNMDFSLCRWCVVQLDRRNILADDRAIAVHKYLQFKGLFH